jgi:DNA helicase HerA-like ATPase
MKTALPDQTQRQYVGTLVGESTSQQFRLAVAHETIREQDIVAVDAELRSPEPGGGVEAIRIWGKVKVIERINPLFPAEAGHELAATRTNPLDTVLSFTREIVTAVCQVLGFERAEGTGRGRLDHLRYPAQPASSAYRPASADLARIVLGDLGDARKSRRGLDIASLSNRDDISVLVDGHAVVSRHLAILAMTGAGKSWTARRLIERLAEKNYPMVIFDPHGDYSRLHEIPELRDRVQRYSADFPVFEEDAETVAGIIDNIGYSLSDTMRTRFDELFNAATRFIPEDASEIEQRSDWLAQAVGNPNITQYRIEPDLWLVANLAEAACQAIRSDNQARLNALFDFGWPQIRNYSKTDVKTLEGIMKRARRAASVLRRMADTNKKVARTHNPMPTDRAELVKYGQISVVSLAGYTSDFQATLFSMIADDLFTKRVSGDLRFPLLCILEEAHNFAPAQAHTEAERRSIMTTKQIAQEGRKFGVGLVLISQRPSRLDETTLSQCNSHIIMRMVNPADQNFVKRVVETISDDEVRMLSGLDVGEAILSGQMINFPVLVRIKAPLSQGEREEQDAFEMLESARSGTTKLSSD